MNCSQGIIRCVNFEICETDYLPSDWHITSNGRPLCINCDMMFGAWKGGKHCGILTFVDDNECCVCLESKRNVILPNCSHSVCISCFKRMYYGKDYIELPFPFPELEDDYYDERDINGLKDPKWDNIKEAIHIWEIEDEKLYMENEADREREEYLAKCPLCRK